MKRKDPKRQWHEFADGHHGESVDSKLDTKAQSPELQIPSLKTATSSALGVQNVSSPTEPPDMHGLNDHTLFFMHVHFYFRLTRCPTVSALLVGVSDFRCWDVALLQWTFVSDLAPRQTNVWLKQKLHPPWHHRCKQEPTFEIMSITMMVFHAADDSCWATLQHCKIMHWKLLCFTSMPVQFCGKHLPSLQLKSPLMTKNLFAQWPVWLPFSCLTSHRRLN